MPRKRFVRDRRTILWVVLAGLGGLLFVSACQWLASGRATPTMEATATPDTTATPAWTATATWTPVPTGTAVSTAMATSTLVPTSAPVDVPAQTRTSTSSPPSSTATAASTAVPTATPTFTPTPIVCDDIAVITWMEIAPGQRFACATHQDAIVEQMKSVEQVPCEDVAVVFEDGQFSFTCKSRVDITVKGAITAQECELKVDLEGGLVGGGLMEVLIRTLLKNFPYDRICIEEAELTSGELIVRGQGR